MINLSTITLRNFLSWGDYDTTVSLSNRGQCFISGEVEESDAPDSRSNGAGKSSITQAILWCLSGKTMYKKAPGNGVLNLFTDSNCSVSLDFQDGSKLTRIRRRDGHTELLYAKDGRDVINCTLSTTSNQQEQLEKELGFDYDIFCGSVFFNQFSHPWMEMGDQTRKKTMERIMGIDRLSIYAELAKKKRDRIEIEQSKLNATVDGIQLVITSLTEQVVTTQRLSDQFNNTKADKIQSKLDEIAQHRVQIDQFEVIDVDYLVKRWEIVDKIEAKIKSMREESRTISTQIDELEDEYDEKRRTFDNEVDIVEQESESDIDTINKEHTVKCELYKNDHDYSLDQLRQEQSAVQGLKLGAESSLEVTHNSIELWKSKEGKICSECEQDIPKSHTSSKLEPHIDRERDLNQQISDHELARTKLNSKIVNLIDRHNNSVESFVYLRDGNINNVELQCTKKIDEIEKKFELNPLPQQIKQLKNKNKDFDRAIESAENKLTSSKPRMTVGEAKAENDKRDILTRQLDRAKREANDIDNESDPNLDIIADLESKISLKQDELDIVSKNVIRYNLVYDHMHYIYRAYGERRRIKSFMIGKHRPYFNSRLNHYLDSFGLDVKIQLTDSLGLDSNLWGYDFQSGGERARTNLAFLFSVFDLHSGIHGRQCNMLVLDEPDHHLDAAGRSTLIDVINNDLANRFETIFVISHNNAFRDVFSGHITVKRIDRLSHLDETR